MPKRVHREQYDTLPLKEAIRQLDNLISTIIQHSGKYTNNSLINDLKHQRQQYKSKLGK